MHFEYNQELLLFIAEEVYSNRYGTFLGNCERERENFMLSQQSESIFTYILLERARFYNKFYSPENT